MPPSIPFVIDCPNQQGQDANNLPIIVNFIATKLPQTAQIIVTFENDVADHFDKRIELKEPRGLLLEEEFPAVTAELGILVDAMQHDLLSQAVEPRQHGLDQLTPPADMQF